MRPCHAVLTSALLIASACGASNANIRAAVTSPGSAVSTSSTTAAATSSSTGAAATDETSAATSAPTLPDPCQLVTKPEAVALAMTDLDDGTKAGTPDNMSCTYTGPPTGPTAQVEFFVGDGGKKFLDVDRNLGHSFTTLTGVGDEAYLEDFALFFRVGNRWNALLVIPRAYRA